MAYFADQCRVFSCKEKCFLIAKKKKHSEEIGLKLPSEIIFFAIYQFEILNLE